MECFQRKIVVHFKIQFKFWFCRQVVSHHIEMQTAHQNCIFGHTFLKEAYTASSMSMEKK